MSEALDRRLTPARPDLPPNILKAASRPRASSRASSCRSRRASSTSNANRAPTPVSTPRRSMANCVTVYDEEEGWAWAQLARDKYVGWIAGQYALEPDLHADASGQRPAHLRLPARRHQGPAAAGAAAWRGIRHRRPARQFRGDQRGRLRFRRASRPHRFAGARLCRGGRATDRRALSVGRAQLDGDRLLRPRCKTPRCSPVSSPRATPICNRPRLDVPVGAGEPVLARRSGVLEGHIGVMRDARTLLARQRRPHMLVTSERSTPCGRAIFKPERAT